MGTDHDFRRWLSTKDDLAWQAFNYSVERGPSLVPPEVVGCFSQYVLGYTTPNFKPKKIAFVHPELRRGGADTTTLLLKQYLPAFGHEIIDDPKRADIIIHWGRQKVEKTGNQLLAYFLNAPGPNSVDDFEKVGKEADLTVSASFGCGKIALRRARHPMRVVWNGAEEMPISGKTGNYLTEGKPVIGFLGRFSWEKNVLSFLAAMTRVDTCTAIIGGWGHEEKAIKRAIESWGLSEKVSFVGEVSRKREFYRDIDVLILPSIFEATPTVVAEAMLACRPVIATPVGDLPLVLSDGRGVLLKDRTPEAIIECLSERGWNRACPMDALDFARANLTAERMAYGWNSYLMEACK